MNTIILYIYNLITVFLPETKFFKLKNFILKIAGATIGKNVRICSSTKILGNGELIIGNNTWVGHQGLIISSSKIMIGADVDIAPRVYIGTGTHEININCNNIAGKGISKDVQIDDGTWIGVNCTILPGLYIGKKNIITAGSIVTKSTTKENMYGGIPAKLIKRLS